MYWKVCLCNSLYTGSAINSATVSGAVVAVLVAILILGAVLVTVIAIKVRRHRQYKRATLATRNLMAEIVETDATKRKTSSRGENIMHA